MEQQGFNFTFDRKTREDRKSTILCIVHDTPGITTRMIANRLGLRKTPYVREMIIELVGHDLIHYQWQEMTNGARVMVFYPGPDPDLETPERDLESELEDQAADHYNETGYTGSMGFAPNPHLASGENGESGFPYLTIDGEIDDLPF